MIYENDAEIFINSFDKEDTPFLSELEKYAKENGVPIIRPHTRSFIKLMLEIKKPENILEVGTAIGFSAILMAQNTDKECRITTIENYEKRIPIALENIEKAGFKDKITLLPGDAEKVLKELKGEYDFIFMDAAKGQYLSFLPEVKRLLKSGGLLLSDNVLMGGVVMPSRFAVVRRDRTIHKRLREYLYELKTSPELRTDILNIGDGLSVSVRL